MTKSIKSKISFLVAAAIGSLLLALCLVGYFTIRFSGNAAARQQLLSYQQAVQADVAERMRAQESMRTLIRLDSSLAEAVFDGNAALLKQKLSAMLASPAIDWALVCDEQGRTLAGDSSQVLGRTVDQARLSVWIPLQEGRALTGFESEAGKSLLLSSGLPLEHKGKRVGVLAFGTNLSQGDFVNTVKRSMEVECTIFDKDTRIATTVLREGRPVVGTNLNNPVIFDKVLVKGERVIARNNIANSEYDTVYWPWQDLSGKNAGMFFVGLSRDNVEDTQNGILLRFAAAGLGLGVILIVIAIQFASALSTPLRQATRFAEAVAEGDFSGTLTVTSTDEVGVLGKALQSMVSKLQHMLEESEIKSQESALQAEKAAQAANEARIATEQAERGRNAIVELAQQVDVVVNTLRGATDELAGQVRQATQGAIRQQERVTGSATAMEQMNSTVLEVARNAAIASEASDRSRNKANEGEQIVNQSVKAINSVQQDSQSLKTEVLELGQQAESIGVVMTVISDIADQTNLLALNAAIEAARAGEAGRGFAVVADEVRKLAEKTMQATKEVSSAIQGIQGGAHKSIEAVDRTANTLESAVALVVQSGDALSEIVRESTQTAEQVSSIAAASEEQSAASNEITRSLEDINRSAEDNAGIMQQSAAAVEKLAEQAHHLQELMNRLRGGAAT